MTIIVCTVICALSFLMIVEVNRKCVKDESFKTKGTVCITVGIFIIIGVFMYLCSLDMTNYEIRADKSWTYVENDNRKFYKKTAEIDTVVTDIESEAYMSPSGKRRVHTYYVFKDNVPQFSELQDVTKTTNMCNVDDFQCDTKLKVGDKVHLTAIAWLEVLSDSKYGTGEYIGTDYKAELIK